MARTGKELAEVLNCSIRDITAQIEQERRDHFPICASMGPNPGYFLAANEQELDEYCRLLYKRGSELFKTRRELLKVLKQLQEQKKEGKP